MTQMLGSCCFKDHFFFAKDVKNTHQGKKAKFSGLCWKN